MEKKYNNESSMEYISKKGNIRGRFRKENREMIPEIKRQKSKSKSNSGEYKVGRFTIRNIRKENKEMMPEIKRQKSKSKSNSGEYKIGRFTIRNISKNKKNKIEAYRIKKN